MARLRYALKNFALVAIVLVASFYLAESGKITAIIVGICFIIGGFRAAGKVADSSSAVMFVIGIALIVVGCVLKGFDNILRYVGAAALAYTGFYQIMKLDKKFGPTKALRCIETVALLAIPVLIISGIAILTFTNKIELGKALLISACVIWVIHTVYALILMDNDGEPDPSKFKFAYRPKSEGGKANKELSERDVYRLVKKIADGWTGTKDYLPDGASIKFDISVEVVDIYEEINYTLNGKVLGITEKNVSAVQLALSGTLQNSLRKLIEYTTSELRNYHLPHSYNINGQIGNIE